jgi:hypothetical protein
LFHYMLLNIKTYKYNKLYVIKYNLRKFI